CNATAVQTGAIAIIALLCAQNLGIAARAGGLSAAMVVVMAALLIVGVTAANAAGVRWGAGIQNVTVAAKLLTLLMITGLAFFMAGDRAAVVGGSGGAAISSNRVVLLFAAIVPCLFAYGGWEHAVVIGGEVREAR